jgi:predicted permease
MMRAAATTLIRWACRLYPLPFREQLAGDLVEVFDRELGAALQAGGWGTAARLWTRTMIAVLREATRERLGAWRRGGRRRGAEDGYRPFTSLGADLRLAVRSLIHERWSATAIVVTLALGIGSTTAVYAVFNYAVFRPVPGIGDAHGIVSVFVRPDHDSRFSATMTDDHLRAIRDMPAFAGLAAYRSSTFPFQAGAQAAPESRTITRITEGYFDVLGVEPRIGRLFRPDEYDRPASAVAIISERLWSSRYAGDTTVIGEDVRILGHRFTIVGVAEDFRGLDNIGREDIWVPVGAASLLTPDAALAHQEMVGRLRPGMTLETARQQAADAVAAVGPIRVRDDEYTAVVFPGLTDGIGVTLDRLMRIWWIAMAGVSILFLLACVNAANLLVARNVRRRRKLALKLALGASQFRVLREMAVEAALIAILAAMAGLGVGVAMTGLFRSERLLSYLPTLEGLTVDWRVTAYATVAAGVSVLLAAGLPSLLAARWSPQRGLCELSPGLTGRTGLLRDAFVALQIALSIALVACTGVLTQTLVNLETKELGFEPHGLYEVRLQPRTIGYDDARAIELLREAERRLAENPGIENATLSWDGHLGMRLGAQLVAPTGETILELVEVRQVSSSYLQTLGIPLLTGRMFTTQEVTAENVRVAVIDQSLASELFAEKPALGQQIHLLMVREPQIYEVIGVVADTGAREIREEHRPAVYLPATALRVATVQLRSRLPHGETASLVQRVIREIEPALPADSIVATHERIAEVTAQERLLAKLGGVLAALALVIAAAGVYSAVGCRVTEQTRELGIRMALGATQRTVGFGVLRRVLVVAGLGTAAGLLILTSALIAAWLPARRATKVDATIAMRAS